MSQQRKPVFETCCFHMGNARKGGGCKHLPLWQIFWIWHWIWAKMDQFKCGPSMVTIDFFSAGSLLSLEFCKTKNEQFWANLEGIFKNCHYFTHKSVQKCNFGFYLITGNYTNEIRLKVCQKSNISEKKYGS